jgi:hypothetical protein
VLKRALLRVCACLSFVSPAWAAPPPHATSVSEPARAIREPVRLTVGATSELMGVLSPDESALYFVSDASGTLDVMLQDPIQSGARALSSGLGDAIDPQVAPDGRHIAYISFENDSTGDVCVRPIEEHKAGPETCIARPNSAELQVLWWDAATLAVLSRPGLHGNFNLLRLPIDRRAPISVLARNMVGLALSPDRRWLAYIPIERATEDVGVTFSQRTGIGIGLQRLGDRSAPLTYVPRLPGVTGSVTFSERGDALEFTQFLNDSNRDGAIDGDDNSVIFRVPFRGGDKTPIPADVEPEQLTNARWDCHYPAPAKTRLIASCSHEGSLDVYSLPLDGAVPAEWNDARLVAEIKSARDAWTQLLLSARRLALAPNVAAKEAIVAQMMAWHLALGEYESTIYDAERRLVSADARSWGRAIAELARHRRADLALIRGETSEQYIQSERARADSLHAQPAGKAPRLQQLEALVVSEIDDDIGDKTGALRTFREIDLGQLSDPLIVPIAAQRAEHLFRLRADRAELLAVYKTLAGLAAIDVAQRLEYAQRFVVELARGRTHDARGEAIKSYRAQVDDGSELALLLDVEAALLTLDDARQEEVRKTIFALYTKNKQVDRRRALVLATLRAAATIGNPYLQYQFVTSWASSLKRDEPERKYAEELYDDIVLDRAYAEGRHGKLGEARGYFYGATVATDSLEAHIGFIEARTAEGGASALHDIDDVYSKRLAQDPHDPVNTFVQAYRLARELPHQTDDAKHEAAVTRIVDALALVADALPKQPQVHQVWGFALHQRARRSGSRQAAVDANRQYLLALDLARGDERLTATLLHRLGILQASMGNYGLALRYMQQRDAYPHVRALEELGLRVTLAQSAWHTGDPALARDSMLAADKLIAGKPELARFQPLVSDRLALALSATDDAPAARRKYAELELLLTRDPETAPMNQLKAHVGLAANALRSGEAQTALGALSKADRVLESSGELEPKSKVVWQRSLTDDYRYTDLQYRALVAGLRAGAAGDLGDDSAALAAIERRVELLRKRLKESEADEDRLDLAQAYLHLAKLHYRRKDTGPAVDAVEQGLALSDAYNASTGSEINDPELALIQAYAELRLYGHVPDTAMKRDLNKELRTVYGVLCKYRNPRLFKQRFLFETYLTELAFNPQR